MEKQKIEKLFKFVSMAFDIGASDNEAAQAFIHARKLVNREGMDLEQFTEAIKLAINPPPVIPPDQLDWEKLYETFDSPPEDYTEEFYQETIYMNREMPIGRYKGYPIRVVAVWDPPYIIHMCVTMRLQGWLGKVLRTARVRFCQEFEETYKDQGYVSK